MKTTNELYKTHRPTTFDEIVGQDATVAALVKMVEKKRVPHAILFSGPSGCGKTTLAYILSNAIGCHPDEFEVIDSGQFKGIDSAKELRERLYYSARRGSVRIFLLDECFPAGTKIATSSGMKAIEDMRVGDSLLSLYGEDRVTQLHKITIPISRLVRVSLANGASIVCSDWHLFLTPEGWVSAGELRNTDCVLLRSCGNTIGGSDKGLSDVLQGGHWEPKTESGNRSRWQRSSNEEGASKRLEESGEVSRVRVACVEIFQPRGFDQHGGGSEGYSETSEIEMYDLSVQRHPSYFANNILVHNCHQMTSPQMDAMLKVLEDTPEHVYIWLATTDPDKLKKAIQTRCTKIEVSSISPEDMAKKVLWPICVKEERNTEEIKPVLLHIANHCGGSARTALVQLDAVWDLESTEAQLEALKKMTVDDEKVENLVKMLLAKSPWSKVGPALNNLDGEPESIRWGVLGYCSAGARGWLCMNPTQAKRCAEIMVCFEKNYYDSKAAGLTLSCMYACGVL
jgi:DNA polymerase III gamma/tau subunit